MKRLLYILLFLILATSWCGSLWAQTTQPKQLSDVTTTEGREFFVAWLPNGSSKPNDNDLRLQLIASTRRDNAIKVEYPSGRIDGPYILIPGQSHVITVDPTEVYWDLRLGEDAEVEHPLNKGIRVFSSNNEKFTLYSINQNGNLGTYSFDGAHILPVEALGTEYIALMTDIDKTATEFVVMSTKPGDTHITIDLKTNSSSGAQQLEETLRGSKQIYIVRSKAPNPEDPDDFIDLSGSTICADQPIAVWSGNQQAVIPKQDGMNDDHAYDQLLPVTKWGKSFIVSATGCNTTINFMRIVALQNGTNVTITRGTNSSSVSLDQSEVFTQQITVSDKANPQNATRYITSDKPIQVYLFSSSAGANTWVDEDENIYSPSDPSMTLIPPLEFLTDTTIFMTYNGGANNLTHQINLWALTSQTNTIRLDGQLINDWRPVAGNNSYSQVTRQIEHGIHTIYAPKKCFSGYAYGMDNGQAYLYPVGYDFTPKPDSLFLLDNGPQYTVHESEWQEHAVSATEGGWYLDKTLQDDGTYLLDSTFVCDSTILKFPINTHRPWSKVKWEIEASIQPTYFEPLEQLPDNVSRPELEHQFHLLPITENQEPFEDFEVRGIVFHSPVFCEIPEEKWARDTFNTVVRVMRQYNDTTWHVMCIGDTMKFFYDSLYSQDNLNLHDPVQKDSTLFIATESSAHNPNRWQYNIGTGPYTFTRHYTSMGGCDSLSTIRIFVCSSYFEEKDTVVCQDGTRFLKYGRFFKRYSDNNSWPVADTVLYDTLRAVGCMSTPEYREFLEHCPTFNGCDSVLRLHLKVMKLVRNIETVNQCMSTGPLFDWKEKGSGRLIHSFSADTMQKDIVYTFYDTIRYANCPECPDGRCDSVRNILNLQFVSDDGQEHGPFHVCQGNTYTYKNMDFTHTFNSDGKICNHPYEVSGIVHVYGVVDGQRKELCSFEDKVTFIVDTVYKDQMTYDTICWERGAATQTYSWANHPKFNAIPVTRPGEFIYRDTFVMRTGCDSICVLQLRVGEPYEKPTVKEICDDGSFTWQDTLFYGKNYSGDKPAKSKQVSGPLYTSFRNLKSQYGCDSVLTFRLTIHQTYIAEAKDTAICANETYDFYGTLYNTPDNRWTPGQTYPLEIHDESVHGCDSMVLHRVTVYPVFLDQWEAPDTVCQVLSSTPVYYEWEGAAHTGWNSRHPQKLNNAGTFELEDRLTTIHGCDSIIHRSLVVLPTYDLHVPHTMSSEDTVHWERRIYAGLTAVFDNPGGLEVIRCSGEQTVVDRLTTQPIGTHSCDSVRTLELKIGQVFRDTIFDATCANCGLYNWIITSPITGRDTVIEITDLPEAYQEKIYYDSLKTNLNYDSIYVLRLTAYPTYDLAESDEVCQGQTYTWSGHMGSDNGVEHRLYYNRRPITEIPTDRYGTIQIVDSMLTDTIYTNPKTHTVKPMHCDSVWTLTLVVHPTYNSRYVDLTDPVPMASNDTISHFTQPRTLFVGYDFDYTAAGTSPAELEQQYERVVYIDRREGESHYDSVVNTSQYGCDSVHYVRIAICEIKFTMKRDSIGDNNTTWHFGGDTYARQHTHELISGEIFHQYDDGTPVDYSVADGRIMREYLFIDTLRTANGCDSIVHDSVFVFPTYEFHFDTAVCSNTRYDWRTLTKMNEQRTGTYYDSVNYTIGTHTFDSVYVLGLEVMPSGYWQYDTVLCMNDTIWWHYKQIYYRPGGLTYVEADYKDESNPCGEKHHLDLTFMPFYGATLVEYDTICQSDPYQWISPGETKPHTEALRDENGNPVSSIPTDIIGEYTYYDSLRTKSCGCDSVYTLHLVVKPAYHFYTDTAICTGDEFQWVVKDKDGNDYTNGVTYSSLVSMHLYDTILGATSAGCDSTYYLHIFVDQPYEIPVEVTKCAGDEFEWNGRNYNAEIADSRNWDKPQEFYDTIRTHTVVGRCDSVMYLHLMIAPSADSVWTDTICVGETYSFLEYQWTEGGVYAFRHDNYWGCPINYQLTLRAIPPTTVALTPEPVCINDAGQDFTYTIRYTYSGEFQPLSYTVRYDSASLEAGFIDQEDILMAPNLRAGTEYELYIPTPVIEQKENYPRPDKYHATIAFQNGICLSDSLMTFPLEIMMSYPNWLLEQRHGDVIAILNENYNGGYTWTEYQWYEGDSMLVGQTRPYLHIPTGLTPGAYYHVELTRTEETEAFPTCEIQAIANPINNDFAPTMGYLAVTPTCILTANPIAYILSRKDGMYRITTSDGKFVSEGLFRADATPIQLPAISGMYIIQLWSENTPEEPYRAVKVIVREQCPNCDISSF